MFDYQEPRPREQQRQQSLLLLLFTAQDPRQSDHADEMGSSNFIL